MRFIVVASHLAKNVLCMMIVKLSLVIVIVEPSQFSKISYIIFYKLIYIITFSQ